MLSHIKVLRIIEIRVQAILNPIDDSGLQINEERSRDVVLVVSLVEEHILPVVSLGRILLQDAFRVDAMLHAKLFPKFISNLIAALTYL
mmetsp:Transcript_38777/g.37120  ORF Transcript_38777/g.37120 Transcript_38777/m.37120 type:complete len:89 (-) Transcript_38777:38-304(-)